MVSDPWETPTVADHDEAAVRPDENPYEAPVSELADASSSVSAADLVWTSSLLRRRLAFQIAGAVGSVIGIAMLVFLAYAMWDDWRKGKLGEWTTGRGNLTSWFCVFLQSGLASITSWGVFRLQAWSRGVVVLQAILIQAGSIALLAALALGFTALPGNPRLDRLAALAIVSSLASLMLLILFGGPTGKIVFARGPGPVSTEVGHSRPAFSSLLMSFGIIFAALITCFCLALSVVIALMFAGVRL